MRLSNSIEISDLAGTKILILNIKGECKIMIMPRLKAFAENFEKL